MNIFERLVELFVSEHLLRRVGLLLGLCLGLSIVIFGFFSTLLILLCMFLGWLVGYSIEERPAFWEQLKRKLHKK